MNFISLNVSGDYAFDQTAARFGVDFALSALGQSF
jgi:hypothetical protein